MTDLMRTFIEFLGKNKWLHPAFNFIGYFTVRLRWPLQYWIIRELIGMESVLDLGCGEHSFVPILPWKTKVTGIEIDRFKSRSAKASKRMCEVIRGDILTYPFPRKSFDAVVLLDVLEHLTFAEGHKMIFKMQEWARKKVVIFTPEGFVEKGEGFMKHKSGWTKADLEAAGFKVRLFKKANGFKVVRMLGVKEL